ncbi:MAG TPA: putative beta-lysine N-acetyltransferase [Treponemataceae bacterium]|nr:putative beta-lysine N-acetyltransferase [Treponemataceae bacterium]
MNNQIDFDTVKTIDGVSVQYGKLSDRVYLMKPSGTHAEHDKKIVLNLAKKEGVSKIFACIPSSWKDSFVHDGFIVEAQIPCFFDNDALLFASKFLTKERLALSDKTKKRIDDVLASAKDKAEAPFVKKKLPEGVELRPLAIDDVGAICKLYTQVFESYPFPIYQPGYIRRAMNEDVHYFGCFKNNQLIAESSIEVDRKTSSAELTDFATHPSARGQALATHLLAQMEKTLEDLSIKTAFTIARAASYGMNRTFAGRGYTYCGTLINNTAISGSIESMNVWYLRKT